jgi:hypothetical protein
MKTLDQSVNHAALAMIRVLTDRCCVFVGSWDVNHGGVSFSLKTSIG